MSHLLPHSPGVKIQSPSGCRLQQGTLWRATAHRVPVREARAQGPAAVASRGAAHGRVWGLSAAARRRNGRFQDLLQVMGLV